MIEAPQFVEAAREYGFEWYAGVPCSYLTPFINYVLQDPSLHYLSMTNEGDAVALIAGIALGARRRGQGRGVAMMQNSGLGNAVSPLTSLTWTFQLPQLLIVTWRGQPGTHDEPQHALMGPITPVLLEAMQIPWELFPSEPRAIAPALCRAIAHMEQTGRPYALLMQKGTVAGCELKPGSQRMQARAARTAPIVRLRGLAAYARAARNEVLREVIARTPSSRSAVLATTGYCGRELYAIEDRPNQLYMVGSMGCVLPLALGLALARPDLQVVAVDGDGAALMRMGAFATAGAYGPPNFSHLLLDNGVHDSTGGQATVSAHVSFAGIASSCGYASALETDDLAEITDWLRGSAPERSAMEGSRFASLLTRPGTPQGLPRPSVSPREVKSRLMQQFASPAGVS